MTEQIMISELNVKRLAFLDDTVQHFNSSNRGADEFNTCRYSNGCAIGRFLTKEVAYVLDKNPAKTIMGIMADSKLAKKIPKEIGELGADFLQSIQSLHDYSSNWSEDGLNNVGKEHYDVIKNKILNGEFGNE